MSMIVTSSFFDFAEPPQFILKLPPTTFVKQCEGLRLECKATSARSLKMCWYKNDQKITDGGNYKTMFVDSTAYLQLRSTRFEDNGVYTCEVHNDAGSASCSTTLTVQGQLSSGYLDYTLLCGFVPSELEQHEREGMTLPVMQVLILWLVFECFWKPV